MSESVQTAKRRVEGLGSAHHGAGTWIKERVSSIALVPLGLWGLWSAIKLAGSGYDGAIAFVNEPLNAVLLILLVLTSLYHMQLGMRVVVEDYVHKPFGKGALLILNLFVCAILAVVATFSILKVAFGAGIGV